MKAQIFFTDDSGVYSVEHDVISIGISLSTDEVTVHTEDIDVQTDLKHYGFLPINEVFSSILTRHVRMENEPTITGLVAK